MRGYYLFGITKAGVQVQPPLQAVGHGRVQAIVREVPLDDWRREVMEQKAQDLTWLEDKLRTHDETVRAVHEHTTIIPVSFGTVFETKERVEEMLTEREVEFLAALERLDGKEEWGVKVYLDRQRLLSQLQEQKKVALMGGMGTGAAYLMRKKLEAIVSQQAEGVALDYARRCFEQLKKLSSDALLLRLLPAQLTGMKGEMILNAAFLLRRERQARFVAAAQQLNEETEWLSVKLSGPWAPYNFVTTSEGKNPE